LQPLGTVDVGGPVGGDAPDPGLASGVPKLSNSSGGEQRDVARVRTPTSKTLRDLELSGAIHQFPIGVT